jgi:hypothetical protein
MRANTMEVHPPMAGPSSRIFQQIGRAGLPLGHLPHRAGRVLKMVALLTFIGLVPFLVPRAGSAQTASGVIVEVHMGSQGSATELFLVPHAGRPLTDPNWIPETLPDGQPNPAFPPTVTAPVVPPQPGFPTDLTGLGTHWGTFGVPGANVVASDAAVSLPQVLSRSFSVIAWKSWQDSGIAVQAGTRFEIRATGRWSTHFDERWSGPEGREVAQAMNDRAGHPPMPINFARPGELIGRIGTGPGFRIGAGGTFTADRDGTLWFTLPDTPDGAVAPFADCAYCGITNGHQSNNLGEVTVFVTLLP